MAELRNRLQRARTLLALPETALIDDLTEEKLLRYQDKLNPLLEGGYHDASYPAQEQRPVPPLHILLVINAPIGAISNLAVRPGEPHFLWWYSISTYFPLLSACVGPLSNCISIVAFIEHWRQRVDTGKLVTDPPRVLALNALSLALGIIGNMSLLMNFSGTVKYLVTQVLSIICWYLASGVLTAALLVSNRSFTGPNPDYIRTEGFWFAAFTSFFYFVCAVLMSINYVGYRLKMYPPVFNLDNKQRLLMFYTVSLSFWLVIGAVSVSHLLDLTIYGSALYFCVVSVLTVGLGDVTPESAGAKVFVLAWSFIGLLTLGLVIAMVRQVTLHSAGPTVFWHHIEIARQKALEAARAQNLDLPPEEAFHQMRVIRRKAKSRQSTFSLLMVLAVFFGFWLVGACIFHFIEGWSYFNSVYFCFLCFITIGYGDFAPKKPLGRVFFVSWGLSAVPLMTVLISNLGDKLYDLGEKVSDYTWKWFRVESYRRLKKIHDKELSESSTQSDTDTEGAKSDTEPASVPKRTRVPNLAEGVSTDEMDEGMADELEQQEQKEEEEIELMAETLKTHTLRREGTFESWDPNSPVDAVRLSRDLRNHVMLRKKTFQKLRESLEVLKPIIEDSVGDANKRYSHEEWQKVLSTVAVPPPDTTNMSEPVKQQFADRKKYYWLSERSPLRLPIMEPNYMILKLFFRVEHDIQNMLDDEGNVLQNLQKWIAKVETNESELKQNLPAKDSTE